jgi:nucleotide-binding universal stress UspA family protein
MLAGAAMQGANASTQSSIIANAKELFARVFVPVDFSPSSHLAVGTALELKRAFGSDVCIFQLVEEGGADEFLGGLGDPRRPCDLVSSARERLHRFMGNIAPDFADAVEVRASTDVKPVEDIRDQARSWGATLVVAATTFRGLFRSPAEKLVHGFDIPVLLIPAVKEEADLGLPRHRTPRSTTPGL